MNLTETLGLSHDKDLIRKAGIVELPKYALDGRKLTWNEERTAVWFESTDGEYHSDSHAVSSTTLKLMDQSPAHFRAEQERRNDPKYGRKAAFFFGTAVHSAVLEPHLFKSQYKVFPGPLSRNTRATKAFTEFAEANLHVRPILPTEIEPIRRAAISALSTEVIRNESTSFQLKDLVQVGAAERVFYWVDKQTGLTCKARLDLVVENIIIDLKTTMDARKERFRHEAGKFGYHIQAAFYMEALSHFLEAGRQPIMLFVVVEKQAPFGTKVYQAHRDTFWLPGQKRVRSLLAQYKQCVTTRVWPSYSQQAEILTLPASKLYEGMPDFL